MESAPAQPQDATAIGEGKVFAALSWWFILGPIFLFTHKDNRFVRHYAAQGTVLLACALALGLLSCVLSLVLSFIPFVGWIISLALPLLGLLPLGIAITGTLKAVNGEWWSCPVIGDWAKKLPV